MGRILRLVSAILEEIGPARNVQHLVRIESATYYVKAVRAARAATAKITALVILVMVGGCGFLILHAALAICLPGNWETKGYWLLGLGALYFIAGVIALSILMSQRFWMRFSGARRLVNHALNGRHEVEESRHHG